MSSQAVAVTVPEVTSVETISETFRRANESDVEWMSRVAVRDMVRRAAWLATWDVTEVR